MQYFTDESTELREAFEREVLTWPGVSVKTTFGCPSYLVDEERFAVLSDQGVSLTCLPDEARRLLVARHQVLPFVANGRAVSSWTTVAVAPEALRDLFPVIKKGYEAARAA